MWPTKKELADYKTDVEEREKLRELLKRGSRGPPPRNPRDDKDRKHFPKIKSLVDEGHSVNSAVTHVVWELIDAGELSCDMTAVKSHVHRISRKFSNK